MNQTNIPKGHPAMHIPVGGADCVRQNINFKKGLVSIIVPCYNSAQFLSRLLDSLCKQTYTCIQFILVNDGSTDDTKKVFDSYTPPFQRIGIEYIYMEQENQGQAAAVNTALPFVEGEYLMWVDADDFLAERHVEKKVKCLEHNKDVSIVCCRGAIVKEDNTEYVAGVLDNRHTAGKLFEALLFEKAWCAPGLYMVRTAALFDVLTQRKIDPSRAGQNWQLLLPVTCKYKTYYIDEMLFYYVERRGSHSHNIHGIAEWCRRFHELKELKLRILHGMEGILPAGYMRLLRRLACLQEQHHKWDMILNNRYEEEENVCIKEEAETLLKSVTDAGKGRQYWIWGFCDKNRKLKKYLERYAKISVTGFVDSDPTKWDGVNVISPQNLNVKEMYLIVPLCSHPDIAGNLDTHGFRIAWDVFYPALEIEESLDHYQRDYEGN